MSPVSLHSPALSAEGETSVMWQEPVLRLAEIMLDDEECGRPGFEEASAAAGDCGGSTDMSKKSRDRLRDT